MARGLSASSGRWFGLPPVYFIKHQQLCWAFTRQARLQDGQQLGAVLDGGHPNGGEAVGQRWGQLLLAVVAAWGERGSARRLRACGVNRLPGKRWVVRNPATTRRPTSTFPQAHPPGFMVATMRKAGCATTISAPAPPFSASVRLRPGSSTLRRGGPRSGNVADQRTVATIAGTPTRLGSS